MSHPNDALKKNATSFKSGGVGNPRGRSKEQIAAANALADALGTPENRAIGLKAYVSLLRSENATIVVDFFNRVCGKPKEHLEVSRDPEDIGSWKDLSREEILELARSNK